MQIHLLMSRFGSVQYTSTSLLAHVEQATLALQRGHLVNKYVLYCMIIQRVTQINQQLSSPTHSPFRPCNTTRTCVQNPQQCKKNWLKEVRIRNLCTAKAIAIYHLNAELCIQKSHVQPLIPS